MIKNACTLVTGSAVLALSLVACASDETAPQPGTGVAGSTPGASGSAPVATGSGGALNGGTTANAGGNVTSNSGGSGNGSGGSSSSDGTGGTSTSNGGSPVSTGGAPISSGGAPTSGGATNVGGARASGGATNVGGALASGGAASGGRAANAGGAASGGRAAGGAPTGGSSTGVGGATNVGGSTTSGLPKFSFFVTSQVAMTRLSASSNGFGGDLRYGQADGLSGADKICTEIAESSMPGAGAKGWRAFLSVTAGPDGTPVNAIDRVGPGPWYDRLGRVVALTKTALANTRPQGADPAIINDLPNETGTPNHAPNGTTVDNHDTLTGSTAQGQIGSTTRANTCNDWTSAVGSTGRPQIGHSWPRSANSAMNWIADHTAPGCAAGVNTGSQNGSGTCVGCSGGYGGIYCFALTP